METDEEEVNETGEFSGFFPSINQFRHVVKQERMRAAFHNEPPRRRTFIGTVKLHGSNAGISLMPSGEILCRSRSRIITTEDDNHGFAKHVHANIDAIRDILNDVPAAGGDVVTIFGEWCGKGIQAGVGIKNEAKMFVAFAVRIGDEWGDLWEAKAAPEARIFNILAFPTWKMEIDFASPEQAQNDLVAITEQVEAECPVAKAFGHAGVGEGVVWTPLDAERSSKYWFKVKGEKHSSTRVRTLAPIDVERFHQRDEMVAAMVTENRLKQGLDLHVGEFQRPVEMTAIGDYLRWVFNDIVKEEADTIAASGFEVKELGRPISDIAKRFYIDAVNRSDLP